MRRLILYLEAGNTLSRRAVLALRQVRPSIPRDVIITTKYVGIDHREQVLPSLVFRIGNRVVYRITGQISAETILNTLRSLDYACPKSNQKEKEKGNKKEES